MLDKINKYTILISFFLISLIGTAQTGNTVKGGRIINVKKFGAKADGKTNDYAAIQKAIEQLHILKSGVLYFPKGVYRVNEFHRENEKGQLLNGKQHFVFNGLTNITIKGEKGTVISIKGDYHKKAEWVWKERNYGYSFDQQISFIFRQCRNVTIENIEINGNCDKMTKDKNVVENVSYGILFGQESYDTVENVLMKNCYIHHMSTDGVCWRGVGGGLYGENLRLKNNGRCALSIVQGKNMRFINCDFSETGITGKYESHAPNTGVDIENESAFTIENIFFKKCRFVKNINTQFIASGFDGVGAGRTTNVHLDSCYFEENFKVQVIPNRGVMINTDNSSITNSTILGTLNFDVNGCLANGQPDKGVIIKNCAIKTRGYGIRLNCEFKVKIVDCTIEQFPNLDEESLSLNYPFIGGGPNVYIEGNTFIYNSSNWRQTHATLLWDYNNYIQGCKSVMNNKIMLKNEEGKPMKKGAVFIITVDEKFLGKNQIVGTDKIIWTQY
ncbi:MAG: glycosyl hydrolase family 28-related protein [Chitinophagaceae bacterium]